MEGSLISENNQSNEGNRITELDDFFDDLCRYGVVVNRALNRKSTKKDEKQRTELVISLGRRANYMGRLITELTGLSTVDVAGKEYDMWVVALKIPADKTAYSAILHCIQVTNGAIGQLRDDIAKGARDEQGNLIEKPAKRTKQKEKDKSPIKLFDALQFHPKVVKASKSCFVTENYREAILNAFISLIDYIKEISGLDLDGDDLMNNVFSFNYDKTQRKITRYPIICLNELRNRNDRDEQQGFLFLCKGAAAFVRNPKAHKLIAQPNPLHTLEYLAFASMLFKQLDKRVQIRHKEQT